MECDGSLLHIACHSCLYPWSLDGPLHVIPLLNELSCICLDSDSRTWNFFVLPPGCASPFWLLGMRMQDGIANSFSCFHLTYYWICPSVEQGAALHIPSKKRKCNFGCRFFFSSFLKKLVPTLVTPFSSLEVHISLFSWCLTFWHQCHVCVELQCHLCNITVAFTQVLGRLASQISTVLQGKDKPTYTPNRDDGDMCIVLNAKDICVTGRKLTDKFYRWHTG